MENENKKITSPIKKKMLLILGGGLALGLARNPRSQEYVFNYLKKEWRNVDKKYLQKIVREFKEDRLLDYREDKEGRVEMILTEKGRQMILKFDIDRIKIKNRLNGIKNGELYFSIFLKKEDQREIFYAIN